MDSIRLMSLDQHQIEGYRICSCGNMVLLAAAEMQSGKCADCYQADGAALKVVEILHRGRRACLPARPLKNRAGSKGSKPKAKAVERAKLAALKRLRALYPEMYDMLYDEERASRGLSPITRTGHVPHDMTRQTYDFDPVYDALINPEGPS